MAGVDGGPRQENLTTTRRVFAAFALASVVLAGAWLAGYGRADNVALLAADAVLVDKSDRELHLLHEGKVVATFPVALGRDPKGHKVEEGDGRTPEGHYVLDWRNPKSRFHLSIHISYPDPADRARAQSLGLSPGGDIFIHGTPWPLAELFDWTAGCIAVSNDNMDVIWASVPDGTPIEIRP